MQLANLNWQDLIFGYTETDINIRCSFHNGQWGKLHSTSSKYIRLHIAATALHYGQEIFEGIKVYRGIDGKLRLFRAEENARRMYQSAEGLQMAPVPIELFCDAVRIAIKKNLRFVPPYGTGASLYIRPLLIGTEARIGVHPGHDYEFIVLVTPVGPYFKTGFNATPFMLIRDYDRAAPLGTGRYKCGGNYAAGFLADQQAHDNGCSALYLDAKEKKYIEECSGANFFGVRGDTYITPDAQTILPSITNVTLQQLALDLGMKVEVRPVPYPELATFTEAAACGTGAAICPISKIIDPAENKIYQFGDGTPGKWCRTLYKAISDIQYGIAPDTHHWCEIMEL